MKSPMISGGGGDILEGKENVGNLERKKLLRKQMLFSLGNSPGKKALLILAPDQKEISRSPAH